MWDENEKEYPDYFITGQSITVKGDKYVLGKNLFKVKPQQ